MSSSQQQTGPPYAFPQAQIGGLPLILPDVPISAVILFLFACSAAMHMTIFQLNRKHEHKFIFSILLFVFSMARVATLIMRILWATHPTNARIAIAASILVQAGVVLLFVVNLFFAERIILAYHSQLRKYKSVRIIREGLVAMVVLMIFMVIIVTVYAVYTLDADARRKCRDVQLFAGTFLAVLAFLPIPTTVLSFLLPKSQPKKKFGTGHLRSKVVLLLFTSTLLSFGAAFRVGTNFVAPPAANPAWFDNKAVFYTINFGIELIVTFTYGISRFDRRFHVPDKAKAAKGQTTDEEKGNERPNFTGQVRTEADVFGSLDGDTMGSLPVNGLEQAQKESADEGSLRIDGQEQPKKELVEKVSLPIDGEEQPKKELIDGGSLPIEGQEQPKKVLAEEGSLPINGQEQPKKGLVDEGSFPIDGQDQPKKGSLPIDGLEQPKTELVAEGSLPLEGQEQPTKASVD